MPFNTQEQDIIKYGVQNGKTREQVEQALSNLRMGIKPTPVAPVEKKQSAIGRITENVGTDLANRADKVDAIQKRPETGKITKAVQTFGQGAGAAANALETVAGEIPGVKQVTKGIGEGINWLATNELSPIKHLGDLIGSNKTVQEITHLYDTDQSFKDTVDGVANIARLGGDVQTAVDGANFAKNVTSKVVDRLSVPSEVPKIDSDVPPGPDGGGMLGKAKGLKNELVETAPAKIMQRVARLSKGKQAAFENIAGQSVGQYLTDRGIFGNIDKISEQLYKRFTDSKGTADAALEKLPGTFEPEPVRTALKELVGRETRVSSPGAESPNLARAEQLLNKLDNGGLDMKEINEAKRLYERNVKTDYLKAVSSDPEKVVRATNIDSSIRKWQFKQAETLGLKNLPEINKETQMAKQLLDDIGAEYSGSAGNNAVSLTDWIMLSGGDPSSVGGFLLKKTLGSKTVQSAIAKYLNKGNDIKGPIEADMGPSEVLQLPEGKSGAPQKSIETPINHPSRQAIQNGTESVPRQSKKISPQPDNTVNQTSANGSTRKDSMQGGFINYVAMAEDIKAAVTQLKKLSSKAFQGKKDGVDLEGFGEADALINKDPKKWTEEDLRTANELVRVYENK